MERDWPRKWEQRATWSAQPSATGGYSRCLSVPSELLSTKPGDAEGGGSSLLMSARSSKPRETSVSTHLLTAKMNRGRESRQANKDWCSFWGTPSCDSFQIQLLLQVETWPLDTLYKWTPCPVQQKIPWEAVMNITSSIKKPKSSLQFWTEDSIFKDTFYLNNNKMYSSCIWLVLIPFLYVHKHKLLYEWNKLTGLCHLFVVLLFSPEVVTLLRLLAC